MQAGVVLDNILAKINSLTVIYDYRPNLFFKGAIKLTRGRTYQVIYAMEDNSSNIMIPSYSGKIDLGIGLV